MTRYGVEFTTIASYVVYVDAESEEQAEDLAYDQAVFPYFPAGMSGDLGGDWETSDVWTDD